MYSFTLLSLHSYGRWLVILTMLAVLIWLIYHTRQHTNFNIQHRRILGWSLLIFDFQFILGWILFFQSRLAQQFWSDPGIMVKVRDVRFFGLEHVTMMTLAAIGLHILVWRSAKYIGKNEGFNTILRWFLFITFIILISIPWSFSPFTHRPLYR